MEEDIDIMHELYLAILQKEYAKNLKKSETCPEGEEEKYVLLCKSIESLAIDMGYTFTIPTSTIH